MVGRSAAAGPRRWPLRRRCTNASVGRRMSGSSLTSSGLARGIGALEERLCRLAAALQVDSLSAFSSKFLDICCRLERVEMLLFSCNFDQFKEIDSLLDTLKAGSSAADKAAMFGTPCLDISDVEAGRADADDWGMSFMDDAKKELPISLASTPRAAAEQPARSDSPLMVTRAPEGLDFREARSRGNRFDPPTRVDYDGSTARHVSAMVVLEREKAAAAASTNADMWETSSDDCDRPHTAGRSSSGCTAPLLGAQARRRERCIADTDGAVGYEGYNYSSTGCEEDVAASDDAGGENEEELSFEEMCMKICSFGDRLESLGPGFCDPATDEGCEADTFGRMASGSSSAKPAGSKRDGQ
eukprot:TRINITY_DN25825_c0_g1_i1.p1 TRINITY_DN25825_c0_g1~~TRINITY_DN25825_c0_g1_i1.p1  ORF type:complete len:357 (-),score=59.79 TRINITY_DN25825_c0_g1_i1:136-1206(-)